jgi:hypothetical protein
MKFNVGRDDATELTEAQILEQLKMYIAAARIADAFGCDAMRMLVAFMQEFVAKDANWMEKKPTRGQFGRTLNQFFEIGIASQPG